MPANRRVEDTINRFREIFLNFPDFVGFGIDGAIAETGDKDKLVSKNFPTG